MEWQPIETAPKDGTVVMLHDPDIFWPVVAEFREGGWWEILGVNLDPEPTHWMPLPEAPK